MKTIALTVFAAALGFAQSSTSTSTPPPNTPKTDATATKKKPPQPPKQAPKQTPEQEAKAQRTQTQSIPAGAKLVEPNLYRYTDSDGKTWNYRQTPFGISKWEETSTPASQSAPESSQAKSVPVVVTDLGDRYRFEKKTPFGQSSWTRKKTELTDEEKALTRDQQGQSNPSSTSVNSKAAGNQ
jgi:hypothetical protein